MNLPELPSGVYRHYKNHLYFAFGYGLDANIDGRVVVIYIGLELEGASPGPRLHPRTAISDDPDVDAWWDFVHEDDGTKCTGNLTDGICSLGRAIKPRFEYIGPSWEVES